MVLHKTCHFLRNKNKHCYCEKNESESHIFKRRNRHVSVVVSSPTRNPEVLDSIFRRTQCRNGRRNYFASGVDMNKLRSGCIHPEYTANQLMMRYAAGESGRFIVARTVSTLKHWIRIGGPLTFVPATLYRVLWSQKPVCRSCEPTGLKFAEPDNDETHLHSLRKSLATSWS